MIEFATKQVRLVFTVFLIVIGLGLVALVTMPREEDPRLKNRWGFISIIYPGADPQTLEQLAVRPIEERLREVSSIKKVETTIRPEWAGINIELKDSVTEIDEAWTQVQSAMDRERGYLPTGIREISLDRDSNAVESILLSISLKKEAKGSAGETMLRREARALRSHILENRLAARVTLYGDPGEELGVTLNEEALRARGVSALQVVQALKDASSSVPAGRWRQSGLEIPILSDTRVSDISDITSVQIPTRGGGSVSINELGRVAYQETRPVEVKARTDAKRSIVLALVPTEKIDVTKLGAALREEIRTFTTAHPDIEIHEVAFAPDRTGERLTGLWWSLVQGVISVGILLLAWMGWRMGLIVSIALPAISLLGLAVYFLGGGILHQISLAAFVISLGQFIDNVIVVVEFIQRKVDEGIEAKEAAVKAIREFRKPMAFATGTAIACFVPMLASEGATAEFTFAIPLIAVVTLIASYFFSILVVPIASAKILRPSRKSMSSQYDRFADWVTKLVSRRTKTVVTSSIAVIVLCGAGMSVVKKEFFPAADRNEFVLRLDLPDGSETALTDKDVAVLEKHLLADSSVKSVTSFIGQGTPLFYYNLLPSGNASHKAELIVTTISHTENSNVIRRVRNFIDQSIPQARLVVQVLEQGPPIRAPIEFRIQGNNLEAMGRVADEIVDALKRQEGTEDVRHNMGLGLVSLGVNFSDAAGVKLAVGRSDFAANLLTRTNGIEVGRVGGDDDTLPLRVFVQQNAHRFADSGVIDSEGGVLTVKDVSTTELKLTPSVIFRRDGIREISVLAGLKSGASFDRVTSAVLENLDQSKGGIPNGIRVEMGGQAEGSGEANLSVMRAIPLGLILLLACLLLEFNSFRRIGAIFFALPLAIAGVVPGLLIGNAPFGFMSLLGVLSLVGIVVNNAILLIESLDDFVSDGLSVVDAVRETLKIRTRPILMTASLTIVGMVPLAFEASSLWPPLAWSMITGLMASTILTLIVLPALYILLINQKSFKVAGSQKFAVLTVLTGFVFTLVPPSVSEARSFAIAELWQEAQMTSPEAQSAADEARAAAAASDKARKALFNPKLAIESEIAWRDRDRNSTTAFGNFNYGSRRDVIAAAVVNQTLLDPELMFGGRQAAKSAAEARAAGAKRASWASGYEAAIYAIEHHRAEAQLKLIEKTQVNLAQQATDLTRLAAIGRAGPSDSLRVKVDVGSLEQERLKLKAVSERLKKSVQRIVPDYSSLASLDVSSSQSVSSDARSDQRALAFEAESYRQVSRSNSATWIPKITAEARYLYADQNLLVEKEWGEVGLKLQWPIFEGGTRQSASQEALALQSAALHRLEGAKRHQEMEVESARLMKRAAEERLPIVFENEKRARAALKIEWERVRSGRLGLERYLDSERVALKVSRELVDAECDRAKAEAELKWALEN
jgi:multidrug efflux pump subunit AcrB/outer membrane protein TolC